MRARAAVEKPRFFAAPPAGAHGVCQFDDARLVWWTGNDACEGWGYAGPWGPQERVLWEAAGALAVGKNWERVQGLSTREMEAYLRERNSVPAFPEGVGPEGEAAWARIQAALEAWRLSGASAVSYVFPSDKRFRELPLAEKIHELKAFFQSEKLLPFLRRGGRIELLDVEGTTVFLALSTADVPPAAFLDWLQMSAAETFREPALNLVPEAAPSGPL